MVCNTESRYIKFYKEIEKPVAEGKLLSKYPQRLRGKMQFEESQLYGRTGKRCRRRGLADFTEKRFF